MIHTNGTDCVKSIRGTLAEDKGSWLILGRVGDLVGLSSNDTAGWVGIDGDGEGRRDEGSARNDDLEETHVDGSDECC